MKSDIALISKHDIKYFTSPNRTHEPLPTLTAQAPGAPARPARATAAWSASSGCACARASLLGLRSQKAFHGKEELLSSLLSQSFSTFPPPPYFWCASLDWQSWKFRVEWKNTRKKGSRLKVLHSSFLSYFIRYRNHKEAKVLLVVHGPTVHYSLLARSGKPSFLQR